MLEILDKILSNDTFLETKFEQYPFQIKSDKDVNLSSKFDLIIDSLERKDKTIKNEYDNFISKYGNNMILINYNGKTYNIYREPVIFQFLNETQSIFKVYEQKQLKDVLFELEQYYGFRIGKIGYDSLTIINLKQEGKIKNRVIIIPLIAEIFNAFCKRINFEDLKKFIYIDIEKELLEPFFLYIEKKELGYEYNNKFNYDLLIKNLLFVMNKERENFINQLNNYAEIDIQKEPMIIIGNDGIGKTLTLQLYTLIKLKEYKKFYFNLKLFEKCNPRVYFLIELMRGFKSEEENEHKDDFKHYIKCIIKYQGRDFSSINKIFSVLNDILIDLKFSGK